MALACHSGVLADVEFTGARILQGIGGAMMVPVGRLAVLRVTPKDQLVRAISVITWPGPVAPVLGRRSVVHHDILHVALDFLPESAAWTGRYSTRVALPRHGTRHGFPPFRCARFRADRRRGHVGHVCDGGDRPRRHVVALVAGVSGNRRCVLRGRVVPSSTQRTSHDRFIRIPDQDVCGRHLRRFVVPDFDRRGAVSTAPDVSGRLAALFVSGVARSLQFTAINTLGFADVPKPQMSGASTLSSTMSQMTMGMGVAAGAIALRIAAWWHGHDPQTLVPADFSIAFLMVAALSVMGIFDVFTLAPDAGEHVSGHRRTVGTS